jgi:hypothetical protein
MTSSTGNKKEAVVRVELDSGYGRRGVKHMRAHCSACDLITRLLATYARWWQALQIGRLFVVL